MTQEMNLQKGLVGHWTMNDADTSGGTLYDSSAQNNHMSLVNSPTTGASGIVGEAYEFTNDSNEGASTGGGTGLDFTGDISYSLWMIQEDTLDTTSNNDYKRPLSFGINSSSIIIEENSELNPSVEIDGNREGLRAGGVTVGEWTHVVMTYDSSTDTMVLYQDAVEEGSATLPSGTRQPASDALDICKNRAIGGRLDDVRIYNRSLSADEINQLYQMREQRQYNI